LSSACDEIRLWATGRKDLTPCPPLNVCSADADRDLGGCDIITENEIDVVSKTLVKINEKVKGRTSREFIETWR